MRKTNGQKASQPIFRGAVNEHQERVLEGVGIWAAYYRSNVHRFVEDYLHVKLKLFQIILLVMMNQSALFVLIAARGRQAKGFGG